MRHPSNMRPSLRQQLRLSIQSAFAYRPDVASSEFVVDLGCELGHGASTLHQSTAQSAFTVGVDLFKPYLDRAKEKGLYTAVLERDVVDFMRHLHVARYPDYLVFCCEVLEHLPRERGEDLLRLIEEKATYAFVSVPHGLTKQDELDGNPLQRHLSGWTRADFEDRGWSIRLDNDEHDLICAVWINKENT